MKASNSFCRIFVPSSSKTINLNFYWHASTVGVINQLVRIRNNLLFQTQRRIHIWWPTETGCFFLRESASDMCSNYANNFCRETF